MTLRVLTLTCKSITGNFREFDLQNVFQERFPLRSFINKHQISIFTQRSESHLIYHYRLSSKVVGGGEVTELLLIVHVDRCARNVQVVIVSLLSVQNANICFVDRAIAPCAVKCMAR